MASRVVDSVLASLRRTSPSRRAGLVLLALVVVAAAWRTVPAFDWVSGEIDATAGLTRAAREVASARAADIDPRPIERAAAVIPPDATFAVLVGADYPFTFERTGALVPGWAAYRLLPRRRVADAAAADWVISYGEPLRPHDVYPVQTVDAGLDVTLARVR